MRKVFIEGAAIILSFLSLWMISLQVDWMTLLRVEQATKKTEEKLGELFWDIFKKTEQENLDPLVINSIDSLLNKLCTENLIDRNQIKLHILNKDEINAFALPDGHLIVFTGLITASENEGELSGVIGHELAHIQLNHVMHKLVREVGLTVLISMTTGNGSSEIIKETAKMLSSSAFDRELEKEADLKSVDYMITAGIDPESLANFLYKLSYAENDMIKYLNWISTHPDSKERAEYIVEYSKDRPTINKPILAKETWNNLIQKLETQQ